jgi:hypothetical protein
VAGGGSSSLQQVLLAITLPTTPGADLQIYDAAVNTAVNASRLRILDGVQQLFANKYQLPKMTSFGGTGTSSGSTTSSTSSSTGTSSGTA